MRDLSVLSDVEFEELAADLLAADLGASVERFARGPDGGVDLRWAQGGGVAVGQCKHYVRSTFSQLRAAARSEIQHVKEIQPERYLFVTSQDLTPNQKDVLVKDMAPWLHGPSDVLGSRDVDGLITRFPQVEQAHPKLWLSTGMQLFWAAHSDLAARSAALRARIERAVPRYVTNESFARGRSMLDAQRVCVIAGLPGIGKTTLAYALMADAMSSGYEPVEVSADINDAWTAYRPDVPQVFLYDDFLGQLTFSERLGKNEDARLADFIDKVSGTKSKMLIMTTREYILQDARRTYARLGAIDRAKHLILELNDYTREDRARILYNHLWHAGLPSSSLNDVATDACIEIIDHPNYSPRLIEYCTGASFDCESDGYARRFIEALDHPERIWRTAFEDHLNFVQQLVAVVLATLPTRVDFDDLKSAHESLCRKRGVVVTAAKFRNGLQMMEGTFVAVDMVYGTSKVHFHNPSVRAFVLDWIGKDRSLVADLIGSAVFFEQVSYLYQYATGDRGARHPSEPSASDLAATVSSLGENLTRALTELISSPTPKRGGRFVGDVNQPVTSWLEDRLRFLIELPPELRPSPRWLVGRLEDAQERWEEGEGHKRRALELVEHLESAADHSIPSTAIERTAEALDAWLARNLEETDDDWLPYLERLEKAHGVELEDADGIATRFEDHTLDELRRWSPSPPDLPELVEYAKRFGLVQLTDALENKAREDEQRDEDPDPDRRRDHTPVSPPRMSDEDLVRMFARLGSSVE